MTNRTKALWRSWAILIVLARRMAPMRTKDILFEIERDGWDVLPVNGRMDSVHASCSKLSTDTKFQSGKPMHANKVERLSGKPAQWQLTQVGREFVQHFLAENHNITAEKSREAALR